MTAAKFAMSAAILKQAIETFNPTHIVSMVSGGKDSAACDQVARDLGCRIDLVVHGNTRCGIPETTEFVRETYGALGEYAEADAGTAYEDYVLRKGFFGKGIAAHGFSYRVLKATPFRKVMSASIRQRQRNIRILLLNGARKDESANRQAHLQVYKPDPAAPNNVWVNLIHDWTLDDRNEYLSSSSTKINPVATQLCRSGECMCGTMQTNEERWEAAALYPKWGAWLTELEAQAKKAHGFGWGDQFPKARNCRMDDMFQPLCAGCEQTNPEQHTQAAAVAAKEREARK